MSLSKPNIGIITKEKFEEMKRRKEYESKQKNKRQKTEG